MAADIARHQRGLLAMLFTVLIWMKIFPHIPHNIVDPCSGLLSSLTRCCLFVRNGVTLERAYSAPEIRAGRSLDYYMCFLVLLYLI